MTNGPGSLRDCFDMLLMCPGCSGARGFHQQQGWDADTLQPERFSMFAILAETS